MASVLLGLADPQGSSGIYFYVPDPDETIDTPGYEVLSRDSNYNWIAGQRLSRKPAMQFTGPGEEVGVVEGRLFPHHFGGLANIVLMRQAAERGLVMNLIRFYPLDDNDGVGYSGTIVGKYGIRRVRTIDQKIASDGLPHRLDFALELVEYGDDADLSLRSA